MMADQVALLKTDTEATVQRMEELIRADKWITTDRAATALGSTHGLEYSTVHDHLMFRKICPEN
jgi:hypothetical protein